MAICPLTAIREELAHLPSHARALWNLRGLKETEPELALAVGWEQRGEGASAGPLIWTKA